MATYDRFQYLIVLQTGMGEFILRDCGETNSSAAEYEAGLIAGSIWGFCDQACVILIDDCSYIEKQKLSKELEEKMLADAAESFQRAAQPETKDTNYKRPNEPFYRGLKKYKRDY